MSHPFLSQGPVAKNEISTVSVSQVNAVTVDVTAMGGRSWNNCVFHVRARFLSYRNVSPSDPDYATVGDLYAVFTRAGGVLSLVASTGGNASAGGLVKTTKPLTSVAFAANADNKTIEFKVTPQATQALKTYAMLFVDAYEQS